LSSGHRSQLLYLEDIREAILRVRGYTETGREAFFDSHIVQDAVVRNLEIIGEAARAIPEVTRQALPSVPWHELMGMRNRLIHGYHAVDLDVVWDVVSNDLEPLLAAINNALESLEQE
jgi:uncharacterized protein with HEPN domain